MKQLDVLGRVERIDLIDLGINGVPAKIDTGADSSSIWASNIKETNIGLQCIFFGPGSPYYTGEVVVFPRNYEITRVANSFGQKELRYKLKLRIRVNGRQIRATFTLANRSKKTYPILLGRRLLRSKFIVDVTKGRALTKVEKAKANKLKRELKDLTKRENL